MLEAKIIEESDRDFIDDVVETAVNKHDGDPEKALEGLGGEDQVNKTFMGTVTFADPEADSDDSDSPYDPDATVIGLDGANQSGVSPPPPADEGDETYDSDATVIGGPKKEEPVPELSSSDDSAFEEDEEEPSESDATVQTVATSSLDDNEDLGADANATMTSIEEPGQESLDPSQTVVSGTRADETIMSPAGPGATMVSSELPSDPESTKATKITSSAGPGFFSDPNLTKRVLEAEGRYTHESEHARGGMGRILLVHDEHLGRDVALKELLPELAEVTVPGFSGETAAQPMLTRFLQEARMTGRLEHPSIVPVYELGQRKDGTFYYTMKLLRGKSMAEVIDNTKTLNDRLGLLPRFVDVCQAVAYAHSKGIVHRDLKPDNVMVGEFGETVVIDWGLAKAKSEREISTEGAEGPKKTGPGDLSKTAYGQALGTPARKVSWTKSTSAPTFTRWAPYSMNC